MQQNKRMRSEAQHEFVAVAVCVSKPEHEKLLVRTTMTFTQQLYEQIGNALPGTTSRSFSRLCGRSEGYFGSINAQQLPISTNSIIYLAEMIEHLMVTRDMQAHTTRKLRQVQQMIADEIARRTQDLDIDNIPVRKMIISAVAKAAYTRDHQHNLPAIMF